MTNRTARTKPTTRKPRRTAEIIDFRAVAQARFDASPEHQISDRAMIAVERLRGELTCDHDIKALKAAEAEMVSALAAVYAYRKSVA